MKGNPSGQSGYLIEYFDTSSGEEKLVSTEYSSGGKFWVFEGFAKDIIAKQ